MDEATSSSTSHLNGGIPSTAAASPDNTTPSISWPLHRPAQRGSWDPPTDRAIRARERPPTAPPPPSAAPSIPLHTLQPGQPRSQSGIALRAFLLGGSLGLSAAAGAQLARRGDPLWRPLAFAALLSAHHFLEFWTHARCNVPEAVVATFLLDGNNAQSLWANALAFAETLLAALLFPRWQARWAAPWVVGVGMVLAVVGQGIRSAAMAHAGTNFNHKVQTRKREGHRLVKTGVYRWLRHPSYFGFFWWAIGSQIAIGNVVSCVVFAVILWMFFNLRIEKEEEFLVGFFGDEYKQYREHTTIGIPFMGWKVPRFLRALARF